MANISDQLSVHAQGVAVIQTSIKKPWVDQLPSGVNVSAADNATTKKTVSNLTGTTYEARRKLHSRGTSIIIRLKYDASCTAVTTQAVVSVVGLDDKEDQCHQLLNTNGNATCTLTAAPGTDITDGTHKYTAQNANCVFDLSGHDRYIVLIDTAFAGTDGDNTLTNIQVKEV